MADIKVAIVGTGGIAQQHGAALAANPHTRIVTAIDTDASRRDAYARRWGGVARETLTGCLRDLDIDAVYILTPPGFRRRYAEEALEAGKHVFCEKPLAVTLEDGEAIVAAAERAGVVAMTGFNQRYRVGYTRLHDIAASGALGRRLHFWCHRYGMGAGGTGEIVDHNWRTDPATLCGMTVESLSHDIDMMRWIMDDEVASVDGITFGTVAGIEGYDNNAQVMMRLLSGASAMINASWSSRIGFNSRGVLGEKGTAFVGGTDVGNNGIWCSRELHVKTDDDEYEQVTMLQDNLDVTSYQSETDDFVNAVLTGAQPRVGIRDGYETLRVSHAILESSRTRSIVYLP